MKRALVLGGGGSKGAYELGVWRALDELGISFDIVTGTSIGAMIGAMYVQKQFERCLELWEQLSVDDIIANGVNLDMDIELLMSQKGKYKTLLKSYVKNRGADITPFVNKLQHYFDAERFFSSDIEYACMCVNVTKKQPQPVYRRDMSRDTALDYIIASASCFPAFPMKEIEGEHFVDGGYYDNVPIELARSMGAQQIVAVDLKSVGKRKIPRPQKDVIYIEPQVSLGSFLLFDQVRIHHNMERGYQDTLKKFDCCLGSIYTFSLQDKAHIIAFEERIHMQLEQIDDLVDRRYMSRLVKKAFHHQMIASFSHFQEYDWPFLRMLEMTALAFQIDDIGIWSFPKFAEQVLACAQKHVSIAERADRDSLHLLDAAASLKEQSTKEIICSIYYYMRTAGAASRKELEAVALLMNDSFVMAYLLFALEQLVDKGKGYRLS